MNQEQRKALLTGILALAIMVIAGLILTAHENLRIMAFACLLGLAAVGCIVQDRKDKIKKNSVKKTLTRSHPKNHD